MRWMLACNKKCQPKIIRAPKADVAGRLLINRSKITDRILSLFDLKLPATERQRTGICKVRHNGVLSMPLCCRAKPKCRNCSLEK